MKPVASYGVGARAEATASATFFFSAAAALSANASKSSSADANFVFLSVLAFWFLNVFKSFATCLALILASSRSFRFLIIMVLMSSGLDDLSWRKDTKNAETSGDINEDAVEDTTLGDTEDTPSEATSRTGVEG